MSSLNWQNNIVFVFINESGLYSLMLRSKTNFVKRNSG